VLARGLEPLRDFARGAGSPVPAHSAFSPAPQSRTGPPSAARGADRPGPQPRGKASPLAANPFTSLVRFLIHVFGDIA